MQNGACLLHITQAEAAEPSKPEDLRFAPYLLARLEEMEVNEEVKAGQAYVLQRFGGQDSSDVEDKQPSASDPA